MPNRERIYTLFRLVVLAAICTAFAAGSTEDTAKPLRALWDNDALISVPEPASYVLLGSGLVVLSFLGRARHRRR
jgi:hypothetical protein